MNVNTGFCKSGAQLPLIAPQGDLRWQEFDENGDSKDTSRNADVSLTNVPGGESRVMHCEKCT